MIIMGKMSLKQINQNIFIIRQLAKRDRQHNNASSILGQFWQIINPFINMIVMVLIFTEMFGNNSIGNFQIYVLIGTIMYSYFNEGTQGCLVALSGNKAFLIKSSMEKNIYPIEKVYVAFINFLFSSLIFICVAQWYGIEFMATAFLVIPNVFLFTLMILGIGKILAIINASFADITYFYKIFTLLILYSSALFYDTSRMAPKVQKLISLNPVYLSIAIVRQSVMDGIIPKWTMWIKLLVYAIGLYGVGTYIYQKKVQTVIEKI